MKQVEFLLITPACGKLELQTQQEAWKSLLTRYPAVEKGIIDKSSYENYLKMEREKKHFNSSVAEIRKKEKEFGKIVKDYKKTMKKNKH